MDLVVLDLRVFSAYTSLYRKFLISEARELIISTLEAIYARAYLSLHNPHTEKVPVGLIIVSNAGITLELGYDSNIADVYNRRLFFVQPAVQDQGHNYEASTPGVSSAETQIDNVADFFPSPFQIDDAVSDASHVLQYVIDYIIQCRMDAMMLGQSQRTATLAVQLYIISPRVVTNWSRHGDDDHGHAAFVGYLRKLHGGNCFLSLYQVITPYHQQLVPSDGVTDAMEVHNGEDIGLLLHQSEEAVNSIELMRLTDILSQGPSTHTIMTIQPEQVAEVIVRPPITSSSGFSLRLEVPALSSLPHVQRSHPALTLDCICHPMEPLSVGLTTFGMLTSCHASPVFPRANNRMWNKTINNPHVSVGATRASFCACGTRLKADSLMPGIRCGACSFLLTQKDMQTIEQHAWGSLPETIYTPEGQQPQVQSGATPNRRVCRLQSAANGRVIGILSNNDVSIHHTYFAAMSSSSLGDIPLCNLHHHYKSTRSHRAAVGGTSGSGNASGIGRHKTSADGMSDAEEYISSQCASVVLGQQGRVILSSLDSGDGEMGNHTTTTSTMQDDEDQQQRHRIHVKDITPACPCDGCFVYYNSLLYGVFCQFLSQNNMSLVVESTMSCLGTTTVVVPSIAASGASEQVIHHNNLLAEMFVNDTSITKYLPAHNRYLVSSDGVRLIVRPLPTRHDLLYQQLAPQSSQSVIHVDPNDGIGGPNADIDTTTRRGSGCINSSGDVGCIPDPLSMTFFGNTAPAAQKTIQRALQGLPMVSRGELLVLGNHHMGVFSQGIHLLACYASSVPLHDRVYTVGQGVTPPSKMQSEEQRTASDKKAPQSMQSPFPNESIRDNTKTMSHIDDHVNTPPRAMKVHTVGHPAFASANASVPVSTETHTDSEKENLRRYSGIYSKRASTNSNTPSPATKKQRL